MRWFLAAVLAASMMAAKASSASPNIASLIDQLGRGGVAGFAAADAEEKLAKIGKPAVSSLMAILRSPAHARQHPACIRLLAKIDPPAALAVLPDHLDDDGVRRDVIEALGSLGPRAARLAPKIRAFVDDSDRITRINARLALINITGQLSPHAQALAAMALDPTIESSERLDATEALWSLGDRAGEIYPLFLTRFNDPDPKIRTVAVGAFNAKGPHSLAIVTALSNVVEHDDVAAIRAAATGGLATIGPAAKPAVPLLMKELSRDEDGGWIYALALIEIGDAQALRALCRALDSKYEQTRLTTVSRIAELARRGGDVERALRLHAQDPSPRVRRAIEVSLGMLRPALVGGE